MNCNNAMQKFMEIDDYRTLPLSLRVHIFFCRKCRRESERLAGVFDSFLLATPYKAPLRITDSIMSIIFSNEFYVERKVSGTKWVSAGTVLFLSILLINYSDSFLWIKEQFGSLYTLSFNIVLGLFISAYSAILIGCNYENIQKFIENFHIGKH